MSTQATVLVPAFRAVPRGAGFVGALFDLIAGLVRSRQILIAQEAHARDAESVRAHARSVQRTDPGFAADLMAAADRHSAR